MEEETKISSKKKTMLICSITIVAVILIVGISYAFWQATKVQEDSNIISSGCFGVELEGNEAINISSAYPLKTEEGMQNTPYTFTITNTCSGSASYIVNLESLSTTTFQNTSIRVALNETNRLYSEYSESNKYYSDSKESRKLISGTLANNESVTYNLRMWIDESAPNTEQNKVFASKIVVTSGADGEAGEPNIVDIKATSTTDSISITYNANGTTICKYGIVEGTYDNTVANVTNTNCNITGLRENTTYYYQVCTETGKGSKCEEGNVKTQIKPLSEKVELGDYISMTPTSTSYTPPGELTGCMNDANCTQNTLNPSELNLWRVIKKNDDGTIEMVSEYVSSKNILFYGKEGYKNFVGALNTIAAQYADGKNVVKTRYIGYSNQIEWLTDMKPDDESIPFDRSTSPYRYFEDCDTTLYTCGSQEKEGGGDIGAQTDIKLIKKVLGTIDVFNSEGVRQPYWFASRYYTLSSNGSFHYGGRSVSGEVVGEEGWWTSYRRVGGVYENVVIGSRIRPVVVLGESTYVKNGDGKSAETAYLLE